MYTFRRINENRERLDEFIPGTTFDIVWRRYNFDRYLKLLVLDGIERIEIALKTKITHDFTLKYGPFGYLDPKNFPRLSIQDHQEFLARIRKETERSREDFVHHFFEKYGDSHKDLPLWMAVEIMSYGSLLTMFNGIAQKDLKTIAADFHINLPVLDSWVSTLNTIRNISAHHGRLWNRELGVKPKIPFQHTHPDWHVPVPTPANRVFSVLTIIQYLLGYIKPKNEWKKRLLDLLLKYPEIPLKFMGFPENWREHSIWKK